MITMMSLKMSRGSWCEGRCDALLEEESLWMVVWRQVAWSTAPPGATASPHTRYRPGGQVQVHWVCVYLKTGRGRGALV